MRVSSSPGGTRRLLALALAVLTLSGCAAAQRSTPASSNPDVGVTPTVRAPRTTPTPAADMQVAPDTFLPFGRALIGKDAETDGFASVQGPVDAYLPGGAGPSRLDAVDLLGGADVVRQHYSVTGPDAAPEIALAAVVRKPAQGLDPARFESHVVLLAWDDLHVLHDSVIATADSEDLSEGAIVGSATDAVAVSLPAKDGEQRVLGVDGATGTVLWSAAGSLDASTFGSIAVHQEGPRADFRCDTITGIAVATGSSLWRIAAKDEKVHGICPSIDTEWANGYRDVSTSFFAGVAAVSLTYNTFAVGQGFSDGTSYDRVLAFDPHTGAKLDLPTADVLAYDPVGGFVLTGGNVSGNQDLQHVAVYELSSGRKTFSLSDDDAARLSFQVLSLYDGELYASTSDGHPVVDVTTGKTVAEDASVYPLGAVGSLTFWSDGLLTTAPERRSAAG